MTKKPTRTEKHNCVVCNYVYNPEEGAPDLGVPPGTPFADLPPDFFCPDCGAGKEDFEAF